MRCEHKETKQKLVSWAIDCQGKHEQSFRRVECCTKCGCIVTYDTNKQGNKKA